MRFGTLRATPSRFRETPDRPATESFDSSRSRPEAESMRQAWPATLSIFAATLYIFFIAPSFLEEIGIPPEAAFIGCFIAVGLSWMMSGAATRTPLILGPAVGLLAFATQFQQAVNSGEVNITGYHLLVASAFAGLVVLLLTRTRLAILKSIPEPVRLGINGAVGALLAHAAIGYLVALSSLAEWVAAAAGATVLVALYAHRLFWRSRLKDKRPPGTTFRGLLAEGHYVASVLVAITVFLAWNGFSCGTSLDCIDIRDVLVYDNLWHEGVRGLADLEPNERLLLGAYVLVTVFVLLTDIPGTPYKLLPSEHEGREGAVQRSFLVDGVAAVFYPLLGMTPPIYYSENYVVRDMSDSDAPWDGKPAIAMGLLYVLVGVGIVGLSRYGVIAGLPRLPAGLVSPVLLWLAMVIVSDGMLSEEEGEGRESKPVPRDPERTFNFYMPAAAAIVTTPRLGMAAGLAAACGVYVLVKLSGEGDLQKKEDNPFVAVAILAAIAAIVTLVVRPP